MALRSVLTLSEVEGRTIGIPATTLMGLFRLRP
jgi:hypothetical protein